MTIDEKLGKDFEFINDRERLRKYSEKQIFNKTLQCALILYKFASEILPTSAARAAILKFRKSNLGRTLFATLTLVITRS